MTAKHPRVRQWEQRVRYWLRELHLDHWYVVFRTTKQADWRESREDELAFVTTQPTYLMAAVYVNEDLIKDKQSISDEELDDAACHEVVHMATSTITHYFDNFVSPYLASRKTPKDVHEALRRAMEDAVETAVSRIARALVTRDRRRSRKKK